MAIRVAFVLALALVAVQAAPQPPIPPLQYNAGIFEQFTQQGSRQSFTGHFYMDYTRNLSRVDLTLTGGLESLLLDYNKQTLSFVQLFNASNIQCFQTTLSVPLPSRETISQAVYQGQEVKYGENCNVFVLNTTVSGQQYYAKIWTISDTNTPFAEDEQLADGTVINLVFLGVNNGLPAGDLFSVPSICSKAAPMKKEHIARFPGFVRRLVR